MLSPKILYTNNRESERIFRFSSLFSVVSLSLATLFTSTRDFPPSIFSIFIHQWDAQRFRSFFCLVSISYLSDSHNIQFWEFQAVKNIDFGGIWLVQTFPPTKLTTKSVKIYEKLSSVLMMSRNWDESCIKVTDHNLRRYLVWVDDLIELYEN